MGHHKQRFPRPEISDGINHRPLGIHIQRRGGFVHNQQLKVFIQRPGQRNSLPLSSRDGRTVLSDQGIDPLREPLDVVPDLYAFKAFLHLCIVDGVLLLKKGHIMPDGLSIQIDRLGNIADQLPYVGLAEPCPVRVGDDVVIVIADTALLGRQQTQNQVQKSGLSRAGESDNRHRSAHRDVDGRVFKYLVPLVVSKGQITDGETLAECQLLSADPFPPLFIHFDLFILSHRFPQNKKRLFCKFHAVNVIDNSECLLKDLSQCHSIDQHGRKNSGQVGAGDQNPSHHQEYGAHNDILYDDSRASGFILIFSLGLGKAGTGLLIIIQDRFNAVINLHLFKRAKGNADLGVCPNGVGPGLLPISPHLHPGLSMNSGNQRHQHHNADRPHPF